MIYQSSEEIYELVRQFEDRTLPAAQWTHAAHLSVAATYITDHTPDEALCFLRSDIILFNVAKGGANTPSRGYHETMTLFWFWLVMGYLTHFRQGRELYQVVNEMLESPLMQADAPFRYYSRELILSVRARARWADPDLKELVF